jgi:DNA-binding response OmpR family regulator
VVDDEQDISAIFKKGLERNGYEVDAFNDPREALSNFRAGYYDAMILDIRMPVMNGFELCRALKKIDDKPAVVFLTAFEIYEEEARKMFPSLNTTCFIKKPVSIDYLVKRLESCMQNNIA